jgi:hypothetical protein
MRLPTQKKILREDVKGAPSWVTPIIETLNSFMETVYQAMNRNITLTENVACNIKEITYKTPSSYPAGVDTVQFVTGLKTKAIGVLVMQAIEKSTYVPAAGPVYAPWVENNGNIVLGTITGLEADKTYTIRLLVT